MKRGVVQSTLARIRGQFPVSIAEVGALDRWDLALIGLAAVSNDALHARQIVDRVVTFVEHARLDAEIGKVEIEVMRPSWE